MFQNAVMGSADEREARRIVKLEMDGGSAWLVRRNPDFVGRSVCHHCGAAVVDDQKLIPCARKNWKCIVIESMDAAPRFFFTNATILYYEFLFYWVSSLCFHSLCLYNLCLPSPWNYCTQNYWKEKVVLYIRRLYVSYENYRSHYCMQMWDIVLSIPSPSWTTFVHVQLSCCCDPISEFATNQMHRGSASW